jgi:hypothetical protein
MTKKIPLDLLDDGSALYVSERKIYPRDVDGRFQTWRKIAVVALLGMFYVFPWLRWDGRQAVLFDLPARKFYVFGLNFWPQDFVFLAMLLVIAGLALFFFTALAGRLWCGYACPQTVWTEVFLWMEQWTEGDRNARMKLDAGPWNRNKVLRKGSKHALWLVFALWTGFTFVGFFTPITDLAARTPLVGSAPGWGNWELFWFPARAGVQVHVPVRALPERDVRPQHADHRLRPDARRTARPAQARHEGRGRAPWPARSGHRL